MQTNVSGLVSPWKPTAGDEAAIDRIVITADEPVPATPVEPPGVFSDRLRQIGLLYVVVTIPIAVILSSLVHGESAYLVAWVLVSGLYTTPALVVTWLAAKRAPAADRRIWHVWLGGLIFVYVIGAAVLVLVATDWALLRSGGAISVVVEVFVYGTAISLMMRSRSGGRTVSIDAVEDLMVVIIIAAPAVLFFGKQIVTSDGAWWAVPAAVDAIALVSALAMVVSLFARLGRGNRVVEGLGITLACVAILDAIMQVAQGVSGFTLATPPLVFLQGLCMALVLLMPLYLPRDVPAGLDRLPPQQQVRGGWGLALLTLVALPILLVGTVAVQATETWAVPFSMAVVGALVALTTVRHLLTMHETKRLYAQVERAADERKVLLADVLASADADRHRVAAQLHEQAVASYAAFASFMAATNAAGGKPSAGAKGSAAGSSTASGASVLVREDLARQAEALRRLMLAIKPLEVTPSGPRNLDAPIRAFVERLYDHQRAPRLEVHMGDDLVLDWTTETIVLRIVQEALRNVWRHAHATEVAVSIDADDEVVEVRIRDNGIGFEPDRLLIESGIESMRSFAAFSGGRVLIDSSPGHGTTLLARLGERPVTDADHEATIDLHDPAVRGHGPGPATTVDAAGAIPTGADLSGRPALRVIDGG